MTKYIYSADSLIGGSSGALDYIDGSILKNGDVALVADSTSSIFGVYVLNIDSTAAENSPYVISPDTNADNKRWVLTSIQSSSFLTGPSSYSFIDDEDTKIFSPGSDQITIATGGTDAIHIDASQNVGIGIDPTSRLHIAEVNATSVFTLERIDPSVGNNVDIGRINFRGGVTTIDNVASIITEADALWASDDSPTRMTFYTTPSGSTTITERMRIDKDGKVGIGTETPGDYHNDADRLVVSGGSNSGITLASTSTSGTGSIYFADPDNVDMGIIKYFHSSDNMGFYTANNLAMQIDSACCVGIGGAPSYSLHVSTSDDIIAGFVSSDSRGSIIISDDDTNTYIGSEDGNTYISNTGNALTDAQLVIDSDGNVGIGAVDPQTLLHIASTSTTQLTIERVDASVSDGNAIGILNFRGGESTIDNIAQIACLADGDWANDDSPSKIQFRTTPSSSTSADTNMVIDKDGNVGIGADDPLTKLHLKTVDDNTKFTIERQDSAVFGSAGVGEIAFRGGESTVADVASILVESDSSWNDDDSPTRMKFFTTPAASTTQTERITIKSDGSVGIGTVAPAQLLEVEKDQNAMTQIEIDNNTGGTAAGSGLKVSANASIAKLRALSAAYVTSGYWETDGVTLAAEGCDNGLNLATNTASPIKFWTDNTERMRIDENGHVGIGTETPSHALDVVGDIYCTGSINSYENDDIDIGTESVDEISDTTSYLACVWHYVVKKDSNLIEGTVTSCWNEGSSTVEYSETKTNDIGDTSAVTLSVDISGGNVRLRATTTGNNWLVRAVRTLF